MMNSILGLSCAVLLSACKANVETPVAPTPPEMSGHTQSDMPAKPPRASLDNADEYAMENFSQSNAKFVGLVDSEDMQSAELRIRAYFTPEEASEGKQSYSYEKTYESNGLTRVVATVTGLMDDSVKAEQLVAYFKPVSPTRAILDQYGMRFKCYRGENTDQWTKKLCP